jgi:hypothetical protein
VVIVIRSRPADARDPLRRWCEDLVAAELARLCRRVPDLGDEHLGSVEKALRQVMDRLVLSRAHTISDGELAVLFGLADVP